MSVLPVVNSRVIARTSCALAVLASATPALAAFNPVEFFRGESHGTGVLKVIFQSPQTIKVDSFGRTEKDGSLLLEQVIHEPGKPARTRYWRMRQEGPNRFVGTLTDAAGPVRVDVGENSVRIRYTGQNHLNFDQVLTPEGNREVRNTMRVKRFGITVARFNEVIRKGE
jgi:hypothetical protein